MSRTKGFVTKRRAPILEGEYGQCLICGADFAQAKTGRPRRTCSELHRQYLSRITRRQGEPCLHPKWGTGSVLLRSNGLWHNGPRGLHLVLIREMSELKFQKESRRHAGRHEARRYDARRKRVKEPHWSKVSFSQEIWGLTRPAEGEGTHSGDSGGRQSARNITAKSAQVLVQRMIVALGSKSTVRKEPYDLEDRD
jgi:hypothetical protein